MSFEDAARALIRVGAEAYARGWLPATSGNLSCRLADGSVAITVSGRHKGMLGMDDIMRVDGAGVSLDGKCPSAETLLHTGLYTRHPDVDAVLHTHSPHSTVLSRRLRGDLVLEDYEILKAFSGVDTHATRIVIPVFANDQDIPRLAAQVERRLAQLGPVPGYLIAGHGLYTWGRSVAEAERHLEAFEFLFQCELLDRRWEAQ